MFLRLFVRDIYNHDIIGRITVSWGESIFKCKYISFVYTSNNLFEEAEKPFGDGLAGRHKDYRQYCNNSKYRMQLNCTLLILCIDAMEVDEGIINILIIRTRSSDLVKFAVCLCYRVVYSPIGAH
jgi:hypothetical protein